MPTIEARERETYDEAWSIASYSKHSPGEMFCPRFIEITGAPPGASVLDAGCGSGKGALALKAAGYNVTMCDLTDAGLTPDARALPFRQVCLWRDIKPQLNMHLLGGRVDYVMCCDVMEHIPPALTMAAAVNLLAIARHGVFFSISTVADRFGIWCGKPLHQTVEGYMWWREMLSEVGTVLDARDVLNAGLYYVEARR